jgi:hypothetical protein
MKNIVLFPRLVVINLLFCLLSTPTGFAQETQGELETRLDAIFAEVEGIRSAFVDIANTPSLQGTPGWDRVVDFTNSLSQRIQDARSKVDTLKDRLLNITTNIFPSSINFPKTEVSMFKDDTSETISRWGRFTIPEISFDYPDFPPKFPKLSNFIAGIFEPIERFLEEVKLKLIELRDELNERPVISENYSYTISDPNFPNAVYNTSEQQRELVGNFNFRVILKNISVTLDAIIDQINGLLSQDAVVGGGGNVAIIKIITATIKGIKNLVELYSDIVVGDAIGGIRNGSYQRLEYIHTFNLRNRIEINLGGHGTHPHPIAIFQLPLQFGGYLELARDIVQETIDNMLAAGENVYQAQMFLSRGNDEFTASHYKKAYDWYSKSYDEATK